MARETPAAVVVDLWMPTLELDELALVRDAAPRAVVAVVSSLDEGQVESAFGDTSGIDAVISKRDRPELIVDAVAQRLNSVE